MNLQVNVPVILKNKGSDFSVNCVVKEINGQEVTFKSTTGDVFTITTRTLSTSYDVLLDVPTRTSQRQDQRQESTLDQVSIEEMENYKNRKVQEIIRNINPNENRTTNEERIRQDLINLANELRQRGYPQDLAEVVANTSFVIPLNPPNITLGSIFRNTFSPEAKMSGSKYMHSFLTKDYLLNEFANIEEVKNFIHVIAMNNSGILLKTFKKNKQALKNIILGLIRIAYSIDALNIEYEYEYNIIYKDQILDRVVFDFDQYYMNNIIAVIKKHGEGDNARDIVIQLTEEELKRSNIVKLGVARNIDELGIDEVPAPIRIEFGAGLNYKEKDLKFGKDYLKAVVSKEELADKLINFINGALLLYPELIREIPENITLVESDFSVFEYRKMIIANEASKDTFESEAEEETVPETDYEDMA